MGFPVATVNWRGFTAFGKGRREKNKVKAVNFWGKNSDANKQQELGGKMLSETRMKGSKGRKLLRDSY